MYADSHAAYQRLYWATFVNYSWYQEKDRIEYKNHRSLSSYIQVGKSLHAEYALPGPQCWLHKSLTVCKLVSLPSVSWKRTRPRKCSGGGPILIWQKSHCVHHIVTKSWAILFISIVWNTLKDYLLLVLKKLKNLGRLWPAYTEFQSDFFFMGWLWYQEFIIIHNNLTISILTVRMRSCII